MILVADIIPKIEAFLDAEGSDRYSFDRDYMPAINYACDFYVSVFNAAFGQKKLSEENLRELVRVTTFQTSKYSRIDLNSIPDKKVWTVLVVSPEPILDPETLPIVNPNPSISIVVPDVTFVSSDYAAGRLTLEEWGESAKNIFMAGNSSLGNSSFKKYAYKNSSTIKTGPLDSELITEIEIRPFLNEQFSCVTYLKYPDQVTSIDGSIEFPKSMSNLIIDKALNFISGKQGDGTNLYSITEREVSNLVSLMA